jgi:flagellar biosynthesis GTPase FlhF
VATWLETTKLMRRSNSERNRAQQAARHLQRRVSEGVQRDRERQAARALLIEERSEEERRQLIEKRTREAQRIYQELKKSTSQQQQPHRAKIQNRMEQQEEQEEQEAPRKASWLSYDWGCCKTNRLSSHRSSFFHHRFIPASFTVQNTFCVPKYKIPTLKISRAHLTNSAKPPSTVNFHCLPVPSN